MFLSNLLAPWQETFADARDGDVITIIAKKIQNMFLSNLFAPWQETFADAGDGDGGEGDSSILNQF